jgi:ribosome-associated translation inhibitor RaiA
MNIQLQTYWQQLKDKIIAFAIAMDHDPMQSIYEETKKLEEEVNKLRTKVNNKRFASCVH